MKNKRFIYSYILCTF